MTTDVKLKKTTFKHIEAEWYSYHDTLKEIDRLRAEIMYPHIQHDDINIVKGANSVKEPGDPTGIIVTRLTTNKQLDYLTKVVEAIERVYDNLPDGHKQVVKLWYWSKHKCYTWQKIADEIHVSKKTAQRWRDDVVKRTAERLGWR